MIVNSAVLASHDEQAARTWAETLARGLAVQRIDREGVPYLERYFAVGYSPTNPHYLGPSIYLHHFTDSDPYVQVHSHPWDWSASLILSGGYREERCDRDGQTRVREYRPGDVNILRPDDKHRIDLLAADCWTLFLAGGYARPWAFLSSCGALPPRRRPPRRRA
jgi:hypothetical protein